MSAAQIIADRLDCMVYGGYIQSNGYPKRGRIYIHREVLAAKLGRDLAAGMDACHTCDNRACVNPDHLYEGTRRQNMADCTERDRHNKPTGSRHWCSTIADADVLEMRRLSESGWTRKEIGEHFSVHPATVSRIVRGISRKEATA